jgi:hypothetical protein
MSTSRRTLYLSPKKDTDIIEYIKPLIPRSDFSTVIRELVRDGIKFRAGAVPAASQNVIQSVNPSLKRVELKKKELSDADLEDRLSKF